jgi:hypothetical protein
MLLAVSSLRSDVRPNRGAVPFGIRRVIAEAKLMPFRFVGCVGYAEVIRPTDMTVP